MKVVSVFDAKTHFSALVEEVYTQQHSLVITRRGVKVAQLVPCEVPQEKNVANIIRELQALSEEIGRVSLTQKDIKNMKEAGRK